MRSHFTIKYTALFAALASAYPLHVMGNAGVTQFSVGDVSVQRATANTPLASGSRIETGDLITTGNTGRTQLRFTDGGMVSLQPNSQFKIARYQDAGGDGKQDSFLVDLARGSMRALTGLIGKRNRENYKVTTTTATIGIRGSGFSMGYNPDGTLSVTTELDAIEVCTLGGCLGLNLGESALVTSAQAAPQRTRQRAAWNPPNPRRLITARNDDTDKEGRTATIRVEAGLALTSAGLGEGRDIRLYLDGAAAGNSETGTILGYAANVASGDVGKSGQITVVERTGSLANGNLMILGTWPGAQWTGAQSDTLSQSAFVMGQPTPQSALNAAAGKQARYDLSSATEVFSDNSLSRGTLLSTSHVTVDFGSTQRQLGVQLDVSMPSTSSMSSTSPTQYSLSGQANATNAGFSGALSLATTQSSFTNSSGQFSGFFGGRAAENLGLSFNAATQNHGDIAGAGVFARGNLTSPPPPPPPPAPVATNMALTSSGLDFYNTESPRVYLNGVTTQSGSGNLLSYLASNLDLAQGGTATEQTRSGSLAGSDLMILGSWANLAWSGSNSITLNQSGFVIGQPTSNATLTGFNDLRGQYNLTAGTPVYTDYGPSGTLLSTSNVIVDFRSAFGAMDINLDINLPSNSLLIPPASNNLPAGGMTHNLRGSANATSAGFSGTLGATNSDGYFVGTGQAAGFFGGSQAGTLGLSYSANLNDGDGINIAGAGLFTRGQTSAFTNVNISNDSMKLHMLDGSGVFYTNEYQSNNTLISGEGNASFSGAQLTRWSEYSSSGKIVTQTPQNASPAPLYGAVGQPNQDSFLGWGAWASGTLTNGQASPTNLTNVHYIVGTPTSSMPYSGVATYGLIGGTVPTSTLGGNGQLLSTSNLAVNFGDQSLTAHINLQFGNTNASFSQVGQIDGSSFRSTGCGNNSFSGFFSGSDAMRAGLVYGRNNHPTLGNIRGAAAFQQSSFNRAIISPPQ